MYSAEKYLKAASECKEIFSLRFKFGGYFNPVELLSYTPGILYLLLLNEIAAQQEDFINDNTTEVYTINYIDGSIKKVYLNSVKSLDHIPYFESYEKALAARDALKPLGNLIYGKDEKPCKQEN